MGTGIGGRLDPLPYDVGILTFRFGLAVASDGRLSMQPEQIQTLIEQGLPGARAEVHGPDGVHFEARIIYAGFAGQLPLARHRMVYATLGELMGGAIHALSLETRTPEEAAGG